MMRALPLSLYALSTLSLAGCVGSNITGTPTARPQPAATAGQRPAQQTYRDAAPSFPTGRAEGEAGSLMGRSANDLVSLFGQPRLSRRDGGATVMQFTGRSCTLDAYLYAPRDGAAPVVAHVDARAASDGSDVDRQGCITALQRR